MEPRFDWRYFSGTMQQSLRDGETRWSPVLDAIEVADTLVGRLVARETSYASDRPQDYVACVLIVRCFRLAVPAIYVALSGFADSSPNMYRTVWEITVRLLDMTANPVAGSLGYLLAGANEQLSVAKSERDYRAAEGLRVSEVLDLNIKDFEARYEELQNLALARDLDPVRTQRTYGRLNFREACKRLGIEKAYLVNYAFASGYAHEKNIATGDFSTLGDGERQFELGPVMDSRIEAVADTLRYLFLAIQGAASLLDDQVAVGQAEAELCRLEALADWPDAPAASA